MNIIANVRELNYISTQNLPMNGQSFYCPDLVLNEGSFMQEIKNINGISGVFLGSIPNKCLALNAGSFHKTYYCLSASATVKLVLPARDFLLN